MSESTTVQIQVLLDRHLCGYATAKAALIRVAEERLQILTRKMLRDFPRGREHDDTAGIFNESYLRLHTALDAEKPTTVRQFLGLAALAIRRTLLDLVRKLRGRGVDKRNRPLSFEGDGSNRIDPAAPEGPNPFDLAEDLLAAVDKLPDDLKEVVMLHHFQGLAQAEIAGLIGIHADTVKRRWAKARVILADKLAAFDPNAGAP